MCKKLLLLLSLALLFSASLSVQDISQDTSEKIIAKVDLAQAIVNRLIESLNLRESILLENEQDLKVREPLLESRESNLQKIESNLNEREIYLTDKEKQQAQTEKTLKNLQASLEISEFWHKIKNSTIIALVGICVVEGIIIATK